QAVRWQGKIGKSGIRSPRRRHETHGSARPHVILSPHGASIAARFHHGHHPHALTAPVARPIKHPCPDPLRSSTAPLSTATAAVPSPVRRPISCSPPRSTTSSSALPPSSAISLPPSILAVRCRSLPT